MPVTIAEAYDSGRLAGGDDAAHSRTYVIRHTDDEATALSLLAATAPPTSGSLVRKSWSVEPIHVVADDPDAGIWRGTVHYCPPDRQDNPDAGTSTFTFDTSGGTQKITCARRHVSDTAAAGVAAAPNHQGAIGVSGDTVEGVDITVPVYAFSETHVLTDAQVSLAYRRTLFELTGKVNSGPFKGCAPGECLFLGASGDKRGDGNWEITYRFAASPNVADVCAEWDASIKPAVAVPKTGWQYFWVEYAKGRDAAAKRPIQRPIAVHVEEVYQAGDLADLGIGV